MCESCWELIAKADDDEFLDSLELTYVERQLLEELYKQGEERIMEILELQGKALQDAIAELSEDALGISVSWGTFFLLCTHPMSSLTCSKRQSKKLLNLYLTWPGNRSYWNLTMRRSGTQGTKQLRNL